MKSLVNSWRGVLMRSGILLLCLGSLAAYLIHGRLLSSLASSWPYHRMLLGERFPDGFDLAGIVAELPTPLTSAAGWQLALFVAACLLTGLLVWVHLRRALPFGPTLLLFAYASAVLPPQILALLRFPDGGGAIRSGALLTIAWVVVALLALWLPFRWRRVVGAVEGSRARSAFPVGDWLWPLLTWPALLAMLLAAFWNGAGRVSGYDALAYHLPLAAYWLDAGSLAVGTLPQSFLPANQSLLARWIMEAGGDRMIYLLPWAATAVALYALHGVSRAMGHGRAAALAAAAGALTLPWLMELTTSAYADTAAAALLLLSLRFLLHWRDDTAGRPAALAGAGLALGLGLGTKFSLLPAGLALIGLAAWFLRGERELWRRPEGPLPVDSPPAADRGVVLRAALLFLAPVAIGCGYWLLRNLVYTGNPLYPVSLFGLAGYTPEEIVNVGDTLASLGWKRILLPWTEAVYASPLDDGLGPLFTGFVLPALILWPLLSRLAPTGAGRRVAPVYGLAAATFLLFFITNTHVARYAIFPLLLAFLFLGELWERWGSTALRTLILAVFLVSAVLQSQGALGGAAYYAINVPRSGAGHFFLPAVVDSVPPGRVLSAAGSMHGYGLLGSDHRHRLISLTRDVLPADAETFDADYLLLHRDQEELFGAAMELTPLGRSSWGDLGLWRRAGATDRGPDYPLSDDAEVRRLLPEILRPPATTP